MHEDNENKEFTRNIINELDDIIDLDGNNADPLDNYMVMDESIGNLWTNELLSKKIKER